MGADRNRDADNGTDGGSNGDEARPFSWRKGELKELVSTRDGGGLVIVAADVIYDENLTDAFFHVLKLLMPAPEPPPPAHESSNDGGCSGGGGCSNGGGGSNGGGSSDGGGGSIGGGSGTVSEAVSGGELPVHDESRATPASVLHPAAPAAPSASNGGKRLTVVGGNGAPGAKGQRTAVLYLALEKRFNFSLAELSVKATGYGALLRNVLDVTVNRGAAGTPAEGGCSRQGGGGAERQFEGRRLPLSFQQCFHYQRSDAMELWEIRRRPRVHRKT